MYLRVACSLRGRGSVPPPQLWLLTYLSTQWPCPSCAKATLPLAHDDTFQGSGHGGVCDHTAEEGSTQTVEQWVHLFQGLSECHYCRFCTLSTHSTVTMAALASSSPVARGLRYHVEEPQHYESS